jgi:hypothetical protein
MRVQGRPFPIFRRVVLVVPKESFSDSVLLTPPAASSPAPMRHLACACAVATAASQGHQPRGARASQHGGCSSGGGGAARHRPPSYCTFWDSVLLTAACDIQGGDEVIDGCIHSCCSSSVYLPSLMHGGQHNSSTGCA